MHHLFLFFLTAVLIRAQHIEREPQIVQKLASSYKDAQNMYREQRLANEKYCLLYNNITGKNELNKNCTIVFLHVEKTGGTSLCQQSVAKSMNVPLDRQNHYRTTNVAANCNLPLEHDMNDGTNRYIKYLRQNDLTFVGHEYQEFHPHINGNIRNKYNGNNLVVPVDNYYENSVIYVTVLRNPLDRLISQLHNEFCFFSSKDKDYIRWLYQCWDINVYKNNILDIINHECFNRMDRFFEFYTKYFASCFTIDATIKCSWESNYEKLSIATAKLEIISSFLVLDSEEEAIW